MAQNYIWTVEKKSPTGYETTIVVASSKVHLFSILRIDPDKFKGFVKILGTAHKTTNCGVVIAGGVSIGQFDDDEEEYSLLKVAEETVVSVE